MPCFLPIFVRGKVNRISIAAARAITPPSLLGIDRRIAYTQRKYHSGLIWMGVTRGLATIKFSGSATISGIKRITIRNKNSAIK